MASIWKGSLTFGLVHVPVEMKTAVRSDHISFRMLHAEDMSPIKYERVCQADGEPVPWNEIVKGYEYEKGKFVVLTDEDFKDAALDSSRTIDILDFVKEGEIDPRFFETPYYLLPTKGGDKPYALLREAMRQSGVIGVGKVIIRKTQHLAGVRVIGQALVLEIMRFANELVDTAEFSFPGTDSIREQEMAMATQLGRQPGRVLRPGEVHRRLPGESHEAHPREDEGEEGDGGRAFARRRGFKGARSHGTATGESRGRARIEIRDRRQEACRKDAAEVRHRAQPSEEDRLASTSSPIAGATRGDTKAGGRLEANEPAARRVSGEARLHANGGACG
jgi:DNA end-binding protein Ku